MITNMRLTYAHLYKHQEKLGKFVLSPGVLYTLYHLCGKTGNSLVMKKQMVLTCHSIWEA